ncbi:MAG: hypothetical protein Q8Q48_04655 [Candidatus Staskawiczbacteria bacterium]|nr:hypothetical protein [Candidatus Staskawiczbacteria bacterium]
MPEIVMRLTFEEAKVLRIALALINDGLGGETWNDDQAKLFEQCYKKLLEAENVAMHNM